MHSDTTLPATPATVHVAPQATSDDGLVRLWLDCYRAPNTRRAYGHDISAFRAFVGAPLRSVTIGDVQAFMSSLDDAAPATIGRHLASVKSLVGFGHRIGFLPFDVAAPVQTPAIKDRLAERILSEEQVQRLFYVERNSRNAALLRLVYGAGLRISEACGLTWADMVAREDSGQLTVMGKGGKTRAVLLPASLWNRVDLLRGKSGPLDPVFRSREGSALSYSQVHRIMKRAARRAGLPAAVSVHYLRHAHVSHALDRGAPPHVVQQTVGHASLVTTSHYAHVRPGDSSAKYLTA